VDELEAWLFGASDALHAAFPRISQSIGEKANYRNPDVIAGGTWEALERELQQVHYFRVGMPK
jgi:hypothetical protein